MVSVVLRMTQKFLKEFIGRLIMYCRMFFSSYSGMPQNKIAYFENPLTAKLAPHVTLVDCMMLGEYHHPKNWTRH